MPISATMWPVSMELFGDPKGITATYDSAELERQGYLNPADIISIETGRALTTNTVKEKLMAEAEIDITDHSIIDRYFNEGKLHQDLDDIPEIMHEEHVFDSVENETDTINEKDWEVTKRIKHLFKKVRIKDATNYVISQEHDKQFILYVPDNYDGNDYVKIGVDWIRTLNHTAEGYHGDEKDLPAIIKRWEDGEFQVLVVKSMLIEAYDRLDLECVVWCRSIGNMKSPQEAQGYKRTRRVCDNKPRSRCYRAIDYLAVNAKKRNQDLDKLTVNPDLDVELTEEQKQLASELQAAKVILNNDKEMSAKEKQVLLEKVMSKRKQLDDILKTSDETTRKALEEAREGTELSESLNTAQTPLTTITDVKEGHFEKTFEMDWYDVFDAKWDMAKGKREAKKALEKYVKEVDNAMA